MRDRQHQQNNLSDDNLTKKSPQNADITPQSDISDAVVQRALETGDPSQLTPDMVLRLNQTHGNAFVQRLLNGKLAPNTNQWAKTPAPASTNPWSGNPAAVQRTPENTMDTIQRGIEEELKTAAPAPGPAPGPAPEAKMPEPEAAPAPAPADEAKDADLGTGAPIPMGTGVPEEEFKNVG